MAIRRWQLSTSIEAALAEVHWPATWTHGWVDAGGNLGFHSLTVVSIPLAKGSILVSCLFLWLKKKNTQKRSNYKVSVGGYSPSSWGKIKAGTQAVSQITFKVKSRENERRPASTQLLSSFPSLHGPANEIASSTVSPLTSYSPNKENAPQTWPQTNLLYTIPG